MNEILIIIFLILLNGLFSMSEIAMVTAGNAARLLGIYGEIGSLDSGKRADIVVLSKDFTVERVYKA